MISILKEFEWDMGHRVTNHDSLCKNPHGHRYKMVVEVTGPINKQLGSSQQGMVLDFGLLKKVIMTNIVDPLDHSFMYWKDDDVMNNFSNNNKSLKMNKVSFVPTAECIALDIANQIEVLLSKKMSQVQLLSLRIFETPKSQALWSRDDKA
ncbi:MAG: 6-carboxytetrahydropterin synthase [Pedobacter sp.]|nr:6-carboxytetrahydropterin synthase [Pedobacter sp.]